jgi:Holliday junction resolvasome RuvABC endonuclease subunit
MSIDPGFIKCGVGIVNDLEEIVHSQAFRLRPKGEKD